MQLAEKNSRHTKKRALFGKNPRNFYLWGRLFTFFPLNSTSDRMKEQIRQLIASGNSEKALELLAQVNSDALLLQAQFNSGKKNFNMGLIEHAEWQRIQARVNYAALELVGKLPDDTPPAAQPKQEIKPPAVVQGTGDGNVPASQPGATGTGDGRLPPKVFISYNHKDGGWMRAIKGHLEEQGIQVLIDLNGTAIGTSLTEFVHNALKNNSYILSIISENSLLSGWVNKELKVAMISQQMGSKRWFPVRIDNAMFDNKFFLAANADLETKIHDLSQEMIKALEKRLPIDSYQEELSRLHDLKGDLAETLRTLKDTLVADLSDNEKFELNMDKVVRAIKG